MILSSMKSSETARTRWTFRALVLVALCAVPGLAFSAAPVAKSPTANKAKLAHPPSVKSMRPKSVQAKTVPTTASKAEASAAMATHKALAPRAVVTPKPESPRAAAAPKPEPPRAVVAPKAEPPRAVVAPKPESPRAAAAPKPEPPRAAVAPKAEPPRAAAAPSQNATKNLNKLSSQISELKQEISQLKQAQETSSKVTKKKRKRPARAR